MTDAPKGKNEAAIAVMLVDDNADDRFLYRETLATRPHVEVVKECENGRDAVAYIQQLYDACGTFPDLIIMDINMPLMNGIEATALIRSYASLIELPVVILTSSDRLEDQIAAQVAGANLSMRKPDSFVDLEVDLGHLVEYIRTTRPVDERLGDALSEIRAEASEIFFEPKGLLDRLMGDEELAKEVLQASVPALDAAQERLEPLLLAKDYVAARKAVHSLKGSAKNLALTALGDEAEHLEELLSNENSGGIEEAALNFFRVLRKSTQEVNHYLLSIESSTTEE